MKPSAMTQSLSSPQSISQSWYWPCGKLKYDKIGNRGKNIEEYEVGETCHFLGRNDSDSTSLISQFTLCLPQGFVNRVSQRVRREVGQQREWVIGVLICAFCASIVLVLNISLTVAAVVHSYSNYEGQGFTSALLYHGTCDTSKNWVRGLHLLINILSTILLAASNYSMQCLSSPSRQNVESAHTQRKWLHIGVPNTKNLHFVGLKRCILWVMLLTSSLPIHLMYNSAVFSALGTHEYGVFLASVDFDFNNPPHDNYAGCSEKGFHMNMSTFYSEVPRFEYLDTKECINTYAADFLSDRGNLVLITNNTNADNTSLNWVAMGNSPQQYSLNSFSWMCKREPNYPNVTYEVVDDPKDCTKYPCLNNCLRNQCKGECLGDWAASSIPWSAPLLNVTVSSDIPYISYNVSRDGVTPDQSISSDKSEDLSNLIDFLQGYPQANELQQYFKNATHWKNKSWAEDVRIQDTGIACALETAIPPIPALKVDYCLSQKVDEKCQLLFSLPICLTIILCNIIKIACMLMTAHDDRKEIFLTVGDAISSFLKKPDRTTKDRCLLSRRNISGKGPYRWDRADQYRLPPRPTPFWPRRRRWKSAADGSNLGLVLMLWFYLIVLSLFSLLIGLLSLSNKSQSVSFPALWNLGFGSVTSSTVIKLCDDPNCTGIISMVLLANTPQVIASIAYFFYNSMLTAMLLADEFNDYAAERKPLRVSWPKGYQRSAYYLSLPYRYSIPLMITHTILHWLVSQSVFFVEVILYDMTGNLTPERLITCGYSPMAIIFLISLGTLMTFPIIGLGFKHFKNNMPLAGSCSAAISAACHPPPGGGDALKPVMWGEVSKPPVKNKHMKISSQEDDGEATDHTLSWLNSKNYCAEENPDSHQGQDNESQAHFLGENNGASEDVGEAIKYIVSRLDTRDEGSFEEVILVESNCENDGENTLHTASGSGTANDASDERDSDSAQGQGNNADFLGEEDGLEYGHCSFSSQVTAPSAGKLYL